MTGSDTAKFFDEKTASIYDAKADRIGAINGNLHLLIRLVLRDLPEDARILCVGAGTGSEIIALARAFPHWTFTALEPSAAMLDVCREKLEREGLSKRCDMFNGYLADFQSAEKYDAVLCLLVTHFIMDEAARQVMFKDMNARLKAGGYLINSEISYDMQSAEFPDMLERWKAMHIESGATEEQAQAIGSVLGDKVAVAPPERIETFLRNAGFPLPVRFFQSLMIQAWYARKV